MKKKMYLPNQTHNAHTHIPSNSHLVLYPSQILDGMKIDALLGMDLDFL